MRCRHLRHPLPALDPAHSHTDVPMWECTCLMYAVQQMRRVYGRSRLCDVPALRAQGLVRALLANLSRDGRSAYSCQVYRVQARGGEGRRARGRLRVG